MNIPERKMNRALPGALSARLRVGFSTRKVELCCKNYALFCSRRPSPVFQPISEPVREKNKNISLLASNAEEQSRMKEKKEGSFLLASFSLRQAISLLLCYHLADRESETPGGMMN